MNNKNQSSDGFLRRRSTNRLGEKHKPLKSPDQTADNPNRSRHSSTGSTKLLTSDSSNYSFRQDIEDSLVKIDKGEKTGIKYDKPDQNKPKKKIRLKKIIIFLFLLICVILLGAISFIGYKLFIASGNIFQGDIFGVLKEEPLKMDANGRSNFLIFGTAEDDNGGDHGGRNLTDSIMVVSVDQTAKNAYMISLPRDLWVTYQELCSVGMQGKLNAVYFCASDDGISEQVGAQALQAKAGEILGLEIQYYIHLNFTAVVQAVDAVGGVSIVIESSDPRGIFDDNFDWQCNYKCNMVKYPNGLTPTLDGQHALALARARGASGNTYGLPNANFDREKNQQKILSALRQKALSTNTLTNLKAVTSLIDAMGSNLRTNISTNEIRRIMSLSSQINDQSIKSVSLVETDDPKVTSGFYSSQSIIQPVLGLYDYSDIQDYISKKVTSNPILLEDAQIAVLNGTGIAGLGQIEANKLDLERLNVTTVGNAPEKINEKYIIYQLDNSKTETAKKLSELYSVQLKIEKPPIDLPISTSFVIIIGSTEN